MKLQNKTAILLIAVCMTFTGRGFSQTQEQYKNILNYKLEPDSARQWAKNLFMDKGAWFGFALPQKNYEEIFFSGPFMMNKFRWVGKALVKTKIVADNINIAASGIQEYYTLPGKLVNHISGEGVESVTSLIFTDGNTVCVEIKIKNNSKAVKEISIEHSGELFAKKIFLSNSNNTIIVTDNTNPVARLKFTDKYLITADARSYKAAGEKIKIKPGSEYLTYYFVEDAAGELNTDIPSKEKLAKCFNENVKRWNGYIARALNKKTKWLNKQEYKNLAVKSVMTLVTNMKIARGDLKLNGIIPSSTVSYFDGFWSWDSWKIAAGYAKFDPKEAENQMLSLFTHQLADGMVPDVIYRDKADDNLRDTKPPLAAWGSWEVYKESRNINFLKKIYDNLVKFHYWWYQKRDVDKNGLCEYGSTDGTAEAALWESGMDDAVRYDNIKMLKHPDFNDAYSVDQESVDLNAYLYSDKLYLAKIADKLGRKAESQKFTAEATKLKELINKVYYYGEQSFYFDYSLAEKKLIDVYGPEGWIPLWTGAADKEKAGKVKDIMADEKKFNTFIPLPTVSADNPKFMSGYWRGPVWIDQFYFGVAGLYNYGYKTEAEMFMEKLFKNAAGLLADSPIHENYDARNGKMLKAPHFSWSASSILLMLREDF